MPVVIRLGRSSSRIEIRSGSNQVEGSGVQQRLEWLLRTHAMHGCSVSFATWLRPSVSARPGLDRRACPLLLDKSVPAIKTHRIKPSGRNGRPDRASGFMDMGAALKRDPGASQVISAKCRSSPAERSRACSVRMPGVSIAQQPPFMRCNERGVAVWRPLAPASLMLPVCYASSGAFAESVFSSDDFPTPEEPARATVCPAAHHRASATAASCALASKSTTPSPRSKPAT